MDLKLVRESSSVEDAELKRFLNANRLYLETSAFNYIVDNFSLEDIEHTRAYQRAKGTIFIASPTLLWEIMLITDNEKADSMLHAAQALFDPLLLATPTEISVRYLKHAYPKNTVNYDLFSRVSWFGLWREMTTDFTKTFSFDSDNLLGKTNPIRSISRNLRSILENRECTDDTSDLIRIFVAKIHSHLSDTLHQNRVNNELAKIIIIYVLLLLVLGADIDNSEAQELWAEKGFGSDLDAEQLTCIFYDYPEIFFRGPLVEMATMAKLQYDAGKTNRGALHDGLHMAYAPYVHHILSNDEAFLRISKNNPHYKNRVWHLSEVNFTPVEFPMGRSPIC